MTEPSSHSLPTPRFALGRLLATPGALAALAESGDLPRTFVARHVRCDWGDCSADDKAANDQALGAEERLFSAYHTQLGVKIWVITEADRSATTILLPSEY